MAKLVIGSGAGAGKELILKPNNVIGRHTECDIVLTEESVSRKHARVFEDGTKFFVEDLQSTNGTFVNGQLADRVPLKDKDLLATGNFQFTFYENDDADVSDDVANPDTALGRTILTFGKAQEVETSQIINMIEAKDFDLKNDARQLAERKDLDALQKRLSVINHVASTMADSLDLNDILDNVLEALFDVFTQAERGFVLQIDPKSGNLASRAVRYAAGKEQDEIMLSRTIVNAAMQDRKSILSSDAAHDDRFSAGHSIMDLNIHSVMCAPILYQDDLMGLIQIDTSSVTRSFTEEDLGLLTAVASQSALVLSNANMHDERMREQRIRQDLHFASNVQQSFLPQKFPSVDGYKFHAFYTSAYEVGGDFYDLIDAGEGRVRVIVGDVSGKGVSAALLMARVTSAIKSYAFRDLPTTEIMTLVNRQMELALESRFITIFYGSLDAATGRMEFVNGGQVPPIIRRIDGSCEVIEEPSCFPLGVMEEIDFESATIELAPGDLLFLCSDGVIEALDEDENCYGTDRLVEIVSKAGADPEAVIKTVHADIQSFIGSAAQSDDLTMLVLGRTGAREPEPDLADEDTHHDHTPTSLTS